jgi:signal transduction histidine kinase
VQASDPLTQLAFDRLVAIGRGADVEELRLVARAGERRPQALRNLEPVRAVQSLVTYSQKLAALGRLTSGVAHEVKNPLNAMRIHLELLKARLGASQPPIRENLDVIAQEIVRLDRVVQGFLKFVRPEEIRLAPVQVDALLSEIARLMVPEAARAGARITEDVAPELPPVAGVPW